MSTFKEYELEHDLFRSYVLQVAYTGYDETLIRFLSKRFDIFISLLYGEIRIGDEAIPAVFKWSGVDS